KLKRGECSPAWFRLGLRLSRPNGSGTPLSGFCCSTRYAHRIPCSWPRRWCGRKDKPPDTRLYAWTSGYGRPPIAKASRCCLSRGTARRAPTNSFKQLRESPEQSLSLRDLLQLTRVEPDALAVHAAVYLDPLVVKLR